MKLRQITFKVDAPLFGYRSQTRAGLHKKHMEARGVKLRRRDSGAKYAMFKKEVLYTAMQAGFKGRVKALKEYPIYLSVIVRWNKGPRIDWANMYKGIEDALFEDDRYVRPGKHQDVIYDAGVEEAEVILEYE
jgi:hypothetical protein